MTRGKKIALWAVVLLVGVPVALIALLLAWVRLSDRTNAAVVSAGIERRYLLYVPPSYNPARPAPLVVTLHPAAGWPALARDMSGWNQLAARHGFLVAYPAGTDFPQVWNTDRPAADVQFLSLMLARIRAAYNIDPARVYLNGMSQGGGMAFVVSCRMPGQFAAVGEVAAAQEHRFEFCGDSTPVPMIAFHGTADTYAPFAGGVSPVEPPGRPPFPAVRDFVGDWAARNHCSAAPEDAPVSEHVSRLSYRNCAAAADVVLYVVSAGGHTWPGATDWEERLLASPTREINATQLMWDFFTQHPRVP